MLRCPPQFLFRSMMLCKLRVLKNDESRIFMLLLVAEFNSEDFAFTFILKILSDRKHNNLSRRSVLFKHTYMHVQTHLRACTHTYKRTCTGSHTHKHVRTYMHTHTCMCTHTTTHTHTHTLTHTHTCIHCMHIHTHLYVHKGFNFLVNR